uniref:Uncharacterized protein n=1 Tax=Fibrocapsa japonica TaxID=94617 RepID=A0A7S2V3X3_9STRA
MAITSTLFAYSSFYHGAGSFHRLGIFVRSFMRKLSVYLKQNSALIFLAKADAANDTPSNPAKKRGPRAKFTTETSLGGLHEDSKTMAARNSFRPARIIDPNFANLITVSQFLTTSIESLHI